METYKLQESEQLLSIAKHTHTHTHMHTQAFSHTLTHMKSMLHFCLKINLHQNSPNIF